MRRHRRAVFGRVAGLLAVLVITFAVFQAPARDLEARIAGWLANLLPGDDVLVGGVNILVFPADQPFFVAVLTPACSALSAVLAVLTLASVTPRGAPRRKTLAVGAAVAVVLVGNFARLAGSLAAGKVAGRASLVLFHDVVGSILTFAYILAGYLVFLWVLLPARRSVEPEVQRALA